MANHKTVVTAIIISCKFTCFGQCCLWCLLSSVCYLLPVAINISKNNSYILAALSNRAGHYIFALWFLLLSSSSSFFCRLISAVAEWMLPWCSYLLISALYMCACGLFISFVFCLPSLFVFFPSSFFMHFTFSSISFSYLPEHGPAPFPGWRL